MRGATLFSNNIEMLVKYFTLPNYNVSTRVLKDFVFPYSQMPNKAINDFDINLRTWAITPKSVRPRPINYPGELINSGIT